MRPDRPQDVGEELEHRDDSRLSRRRQRAPEFEPSQLSAVRRLVVIETDGFVTVDEMAQALNVSKHTVGICMPFLVEEGLLREHAVMPDGTVQSARHFWDRRPAGTLSICGTSYRMHGGRWRAFTEVPNGRMRRAARGMRSNRNVEETDVVWGDGPWDGRGFEILRGKEYAAAARAIGMPDDPTAPWQCCGRKFDWHTRSCYMCGTLGPRAAALAGQQVVQKQDRGPRKPETRPCDRCGGDVRVKRRRGKVVGASHARSVCNVQLVARVLEM